MFEGKDALSLIQAAQHCKVTKYAVFNWAAEGLIETEEIAGHRAYSKQQLDQLLFVRSKNPRDWKKTWKAQKAEQNNG